MGLNKDKELYDILSYNFIYKKYIYKLRYDINDNTKDVFGFYVVYQHKPQIFAIEDGEIRKVNTFEGRFILRDITKTVKRKLIII